MVRDEYKVMVLEQILSNMEEDRYYLAQLKGCDTKAINLDRGALELLLEYYNKRGN